MALAAVLTENGFFTNYNDAVLMIDREWQEAVAKAQPRAPENPDGGPRRSRGAHDLAGHVTESLRVRRRPHLGRRRRRPVSRPSYCP